MTAAFDDSASLGEVRAWLLERRGRGVKCPCCGQYARVYKRRLNYAMAYGLYLVYEYFHLRARAPEPWLHVPRYLNGKGVVARGGDFAKLVHWGLLEAKEGERPDGSARIGYYRLTPEGVAFVENRSRVPTYLYFYDGEVLDRDDKTVSMPEALGDHFDYAELMAARVAPPKPKRPRRSKRVSVKQEALW